MRVARVIAVLEPGGAQLGALRLSLALRSPGIESRWLAGHATRAGLALFRARGIDVEVLGGGPALQYARRRAYAERLAVALDDEDVVHAHMFGAWWAAARAVPDGVPLAASEHNALQWPGRVPARALREALARVDVFFAHGPAACGEILAAGLPIDRMREGMSPIEGTHAANRVRRAAASREGSRSAARRARAAGGAPADVRARCRSDGGRAAPPRGWPRHRAARASCRLARRPGELDRRRLGVCRSVALRRLVADSRA